MGRRSKGKSAARGPERAAPPAAKEPGRWSRATAIAVAAALGLVVLGAWWLRSRPGPVRREGGLDVLLITVDTLRADALGSYGRRGADTPWMDRLAEAGVRFDHAHAHNVITLPSHANILSGHHPLEHGVRDNGGFRFPKDVDTLATLLGARGYRTAAFISAFPLASRFGLDRGFELYDDRFLTGSSSLLAEQERPGTETVAAALRWRAAQTGAPVFLWLHLYEPHFPYRPPEPFASRWAGDAYQGEVAATDAALEPLIAPLLRAGREGRTFVAFTADHGESLGEHGEKTHGIFAYEGPLRVPLVLFCPRLLAPRVVRDPVRHVDLLPTILDALALPAPEEGLPGRSLLPVAVGRKSPPLPTYFEALSGMMNRRWAPLYGVLRDRTKYIELPLPELYDLGQDPHEQRNLAASQPRLLEQMRGLLARMREGERKVERARESAETRERLRALGYLAAADEATPKERYAEDDDPKRLVAMDAELQTVAERHRAGDLAGAIALCEQTVGRRPSMPMPWAQLGSLYREAGRVGAAIGAMQRSLALNPDDPDTAALLGGYLNDAGRAREAVDLLEPYARQVDPLPDVLLARGAALARIGRRQEALASFERVREMVPTNAMAVLDIGTVHLMARDFARAAEAFERALALDPRLAEAHNSLGVIAAQSGRPEEAIARWKRAVELDPHGLDTLYNLGSLLVRMGRKDEARPHLERFLREAPPGLHEEDRARVRAWLGS